jgi:preprotein translocase subunit SecA
LTSPEEITQSNNNPKEELELKKEDFNPNNISQSDEDMSHTSTIKRDEPKFGRNEIVKITNGITTKEMKYKKAEALIKTGEWKII